MCLIEIFAVTSAGAQSCTVHNNIASVVDWLLTLIDLATTLGCSLPLYEVLSCVSGLT